MRSANHPRVRIDSKIGPQSPRWRRWRTFAACDDGIGQRPRRALQCPLATMHWAMGLVHAGEMLRADAICSAIGGGSPRQKRDRRGSEAAIFEARRCHRNTRLRA